MIILYGGSFNPPTKAHYNIIKLLKENFPSSKVILMPVGMNYPKSELIQSSDRLFMLELLSSHFSDVLVSDFEIQRPFIGTIRALEYLENEYNDIAALAIGADNLLTLDTWIEANKLIKNYRIIVINRNNLLSSDVINEFETKHQVKLEVIFFESNISSSQIRKDIVKYKSYLLDDVYEYIKKNNLYKGE